MGRRSARRGQAMVESLLAMLFICLLFFGLFQLAHAFAGREILRYAAARAARARTVGFNTWMVRKVMRAAAIPNAGRMLVPNEDFDYPDLDRALAAGTPGAVWDLALATAPRSARAGVETARLPEYLAARNEPTAGQILDYEDWDRIQGAGLGSGGLGPALPALTLRVDVTQTYPLTLDLRTLFELAGALPSALRDGQLRLRGEYEIGSHYPLYLDDRGW